MHVDARTSRLIVIAGIASLAIAGANALGWASFDAYLPRWFMVIVDLYAIVFAALLWIMLAAWLSGRAAATLPNRSRLKGVLALVPLEEFDENLLAPNLTDEAHDIALDGLRAIAHRPDVVAIHVGRDVRDPTADRVFVSTSARGRDVRRWAAKIGADAFLLRGADRRRFAALHPGASEPAWLLIWD